MDEHIICRGGVTPTVPVTASSEYHRRYNAQRACLGTESEMPGMVHKCIVWMHQLSRKSSKYRARLGAQQACLDNRSEMTLTKAESEVPCTPRVRYVSDLGYVSKTQTRYTPSYDSQRNALLMFFRKRPFCRVKVQTNFL